MPVDIPGRLVEARESIADLIARRAEVVAGPFDRAGRATLAELDRELGSLLDRFRIDPCDASPEVPLVLLPVRVETKLAADGRTLRVRITPDEVHVDALTRSLTDDEAAAGRAYWTTLWSDASSVTAWGDLVEAVGSGRAGWVAHATRPTNAHEAGAADPVFPDAPTEVSRGSVARCLPDQFVVRVHPAGHDPITRVGDPVAPDVSLSPISFADDDLAAIGEAGRLRVPLGSEWTVDFEAAKAVGLGVEVELPDGVRRIDSVVVVGTRRSVSEEQNAADLADLLVSHRYSDGFSLVAAGTATNNADAERSPYQPTRSPSGPALAAGPASADAASLGGLLGVSADGIEDLLEPGGPRSSLGEAQRSANTALWYATWHPVLRRLDESPRVEGVTPRTIESARHVHRDHVRAAGHAPSVLLGAQPYGVLPVSDLDSWRPRGGDVTAVLVPLVRRTLERWVQRSRTLPQVRPGHDIDDDDLLDLLGTSPVALSVRARPAVDGPQAGVLAAVIGADQGRVDAEQQITQAVLAQYNVSAASSRLAPVLHDQSRAIALPLVSERDAQVIDDILADRAPQVDSVLQALLDVAWDEAKAAGFRAAPEEFVSPLIDLVTLTPDLAGLLRQANAPVAEAVDVDPERLFLAAQEVRSTVRFDGQPSEPVSLSAIEPIAEARTSLAQVALDLGDTPQARWIGQEAVAGILEAFAARIEVGAAMRALGAVPIEERRIAVASALDVASHRVDAWATALAASRTATGATGTGSGEATVGAFGYVEGIDLAAPARTPQGWLHAPSPSHAVAAGVLASAHRSRIGAQGGTDPFAIDLSSRRGTELRRVLEGVAAGQTIGALLGYQVERGLTGSAARFQLSLREIAPLETDELDNELAEADRSARVAAANVVDGVALLRDFPVQQGLPGLRARLDAKPRNAYVEQWDPVSDAEWRAVVVAVTGAAATLDAVADALLSESVLQYATGNPARASAAMDAMSSGGGVDPELAVLASRQSGRSLTHALFAAIPEGATGWSTTRPRAVADPRLEAWAARRLGDPSLIVVTDGPGGRHTLDEAGLAALDLVLVDDEGALDRLLRNAIPATGTDPLAESRGDDWPDDAVPIVAAATLAGTLRTLVAGAAPLEPSDLTRSGEPAQRAPDTDELLGRCDALLAALDAVLDAGRATVEAIPETLAVEEGEVDAIRAAVAGLEAFGIPLTPDPEIPTSVGWAWAAWQSAVGRRARAGSLLAGVREATEVPRTATEVLDAATAVMEAVLGDGFRPLPLLRPLGGPDDFAEALASPLFAAPPVSAVNAFVRDHATVRAGVGRLAEAQLVGRALGRTAPLTVAQLTERDGGVGAPGTDRWLAGPLPDDVPWPMHSATHVVAELLAAPAEYAGAFAGFSFDGWAEQLPFQADPRAFDPQAPDNPLRAARATTGLAVQANQSSARAPQVILSAVSPDGRRWTTDSVVRTVLSAVEVARARLVTYEKVPGDAAVLPAIYVASPWLQVRKGLSFEEIARVRWDSVAYSFLSEVP